MDPDEFEALEAAEEAEIDMHMNMDYNDEGNC